MIPRIIEKKITEALNSSKKTIIIYGARQVGKTTLAKSIQADFERKGLKVLCLNCDIEEEIKTIDTASKFAIETVMKGIDLLIIDEAQRLSNPGLTIKVIHDNFPMTKLLITGSSSFELKNHMSDPLTGRFIDFTLYPLSFSEILEAKNISPNSVIAKNQADTLPPLILTYGAYPSIYLETNPTTKQKLLLNLTESYLFRDILSFEKIRNSSAIRDLARALAYQTGSEVNESELATRLKIDRKTVRSYIDILEKSFVIIKVSSYSKNARREIGRNYKVYFVDLGTRNALIGDFNQILLRSDLGHLWENFLFIERLKYLENISQMADYYFWRSYNGSEIDYIEKRINKEINTYEFKYSSEKISRGAYTFSKNYKTPVTLINNLNYQDFITGKI